MSKRFLIAGLLTTLVLGTMTATVRANDAQQRQESSSAILENAEALAQFELVEPAQYEAKARGCQTLQCINRVLKALVKAQKKQLAEHNALVAAHNTVAGYVNNCLRTVDVTRYGVPGSQGYMYDTNNNLEQAEGHATALDLTLPGGPVSGKFVIDIC